MTTVVFANLAVRYPMWIAVAFFYIALGTKLAHHFLLWGNLLGGRPDWALRRLGFSSGHRFGGQNLEQLLGVQVAPMGMLIFWLVFNVAIAALFGYVGSVPRHEAAGARGNAWCIGRERVFGVTRARFRSATAPLSYCVPTTWIQADEC